MSYLICTMVAHVQSYKVQVRLVRSRYARENTQICMNNVWQ